MTYSSRNIFQIFLNFRQDIKKLPFDVYLSKVQLRCHPAYPTLKASFTAITDNPRAGEVPPGWGQRSGATPVRIPISFWSQAMQSAWGGGFSVGPDQSLF
jgi:hypothetical protein